VCLGGNPDGASAPEQRFILSFSRRTPTHRKPRKLTKTTLISAGSALAVAGLVAGTTAAWPGASGDQGNLADAAALSHATASSVAPQTVQADTTHQLRAVQATALQAQLRRAAQTRARKAAQARAAAKAAAAARAAAKAKAAAARQAAQASGSAATPQGDPQQIAESMLGSFGWSTSQFSCLQPLWQRESGWSVTASNTSSGAYGIPQALPGSKMASAGADWQTSASTQIRWGLGYIQSTYGSPCAAWSHEQAYGWY
jgi:hypothetical protein